MVYDRLKDRVALKLIGLIGVVNRLRGYELVYENNGREMGWGLPGVAVGLWCEVAMHRPLRGCNSGRRPA